MKLEINPIHGWGWFQADGVELDEPPPFALTAEVTQAGDPFTSALGQMPAGDHPLAGLWLIVSIRPKPFDLGFDGTCNIFAFEAKPAVPRINEALADKPVLTGYGKITSIAD